MIQIDLEMPDNCFDCPLWDGYTGICPADRLKRYPDEEIQTFTGKPNWCPLQEVPKNEIHAFWQFRGPWRGPDEGEVGTCSNCKTRSRFFVDKRCPECGAIMDIKREQEVNHGETGDM